MIGFSKAPRLGGEALSTRVSIFRKTGLFLIGTLFGVFIPIIFENEILRHLDGDGKYIAIAIGCALIMGAFLLLMFFYLDALLQSVIKTKIYDLRLYQDRYSSSGVRRIAFEACAELALSAEKSIIVIGPHFESGIVDTKSHDAYLENSMTEVIRRQIFDNNNSERRFEYDRIVQINEEAVSRLREQGCIFRSSFNNESMANHIDSILKMKQKVSHRATGVRITARRYIPSFPSVLIIDYRYVFFSLPTDPETVPGDTNAFDTVLGFEDASGHIPERLAEIVKNFVGVEVTAVS